MLAALAFVQLASVAEATEIGESKPFGLGLQFGQPALLTGKVYLGGRVNAIDFAVGLYLGGDALYGQAAYHIHILELAQGSGVSIPVRVGLGGFFNTGYWAWNNEGEGHDLILGVRLPVGLDFDLDAIPLQFYIEAAADMTLLPPLNFGIDGGVGVRWYF